MRDTDAGAVRVRVRVRPNVRSAMPTEGVQLPFDPLPGKAQGEVKASVMRIAPASTQDAEGKRY
ncbi:hypothetical protein [Embleya sp. MST-111070]|uniref:hypothetical protein n=1 Tax=Embleya sp. MST-111070 TaxID=3398231 RepID=UPI003F741824